MGEEMTDNQKKIFTNKAISIATFFGGPLAAGFLISKNYKVFGNFNAARNSIFIGVISTILIYAGIFATPDSIIDKIPQSLIPLIYTGIIALIVEKFQGEHIKNFLKEEGEKASGWTAAGYGAIGLVATALFLLIIIFGVPQKGYEKKTEIIDNVVMYYSKSLDESVVERISQEIGMSGYLEGSQGADLFLSLDGEYFVLKFVLPDTSALSDEQFVSDFRGFENYLNFNLNLDQKIKIAFTDFTSSLYFDLPQGSSYSGPVPEELLYLQHHQINDNQTIFYNSSMPLTEVKVVEDAVKRLKSYFPENHNVDIVFLNSGDDYTIKFFVLREMWNNPATVDRLKSTVEYIQGNGISKNIRLVVVDNTDFSEKEI